MSADGGGSPSGALADAINAKFGGLDGLKEKVNAAGAGQFGSGWTWLAVNGSGDLEIFGTPNQDSPLMSGKTRSSELTSGSTLTISSTRMRVQDISPNGGMSSTGTLLRLVTRRQPASRYRSN